MLRSQVVVNLLLKLGQGVNRVADYNGFGDNLWRGKHLNELDKRAGGLVHSMRCKRL